jgi:hypothetical protein
VDLLRPRAIPALIALAALALPCAALECDSVQGTYRYKSAGPGEPVSLSVLTLSKERSKLFRVDEKAPGTGWQAGGTQPRPAKTTPLAETATLIHTAKDTRLRFMDASGKVLAEMTINDTGRWACKSKRLERSRSRTAGLGDDIRSEKVVETLERNDAGDLLLKTTVTVASPPGKPPKVVEARFPAVR